MDFLDRLLYYPVAHMPFFLIAILIAFSVHEFSHAYFANKFGDPTAKLLGRVTLNPASHIDFFGAFLLVFAGFGWARPVPVNRENFSNPRVMSLIVTAAGPISNLLLGIVGTFIYIGLNHFGVISHIEGDTLSTSLILFFYYFNFMNYFLFVFNLIPLPPLDGYRILEELVPRTALVSLKKIENWAMFIFLLILIVPQIQMYTIGPLRSFAVTLYSGFVNLAFNLFSLF